MCQQWITFPLRTPSRKEIERKRLKQKIIASGNKDLLKLHKVCQEFKEILDNMKKIIEGVDD